jgi:tRNA nucleotidyltransferase (CCA-adding enzyme)
MAGVCCVAEAFPLERIAAPVRDIAARLRESGHEVWFVGGAVRDTIFEVAHGRLPVRAGDFDIATSARPEQVQAIFRRTVPVGIEHGTVAVLDPKGGAHEVTTFRRDVKTDGRHAEVEFGVSLEDDLARRDFTINAIAVHPDTGELRDPFGGRADLAAGLVRAVGDPATRFREDRLRVLRGLRFAAAFGFTVEPATWLALCASAGDLERLSRERLRDEWIKTLATSTPSVAVGLWRTAGVLAPVWPELASLPAHAEGWLDAVTPREPVLVTAAALSYTAAAQQHSRTDAQRTARDAMRRMKFSNQEIARVEQVVAALADALPDVRDAVALRRWIARHRAVAQDAAGAMPAARPDRERFRASVESILGSGVPLGLGDLAVTGEDLKAAGLVAGPKLGQTLRRLLDIVLDDPSQNTKERLLELAVRG